MSKTMASFKCSGCGRTDFFTGHGFAKHGRKCKGARTAPSTNSRKWAEDVKRRGFSGSGKAGYREASASKQKYNRQHVERVVARFHGDVSAAIRAGAITEDDYGRYEASLY